MIDAVFIGQGVFASGHTWYARTACVAWQLEAFTRTASTPFKATGWMLASRLDLYTSHYKP